MGSDAGRGSMAAAGGKIQRRSSSGQRIRGGLTAVLLLLAATAEASDLATLAAVSADDTVIAAGGAASGLAATTRGTATRDTVRAAGIDGDALWFADHVLVDKSERMLHLMSGGEIMRSHRISLGKNPVGDKQREGDLRTPEGRYVLDWRNPTSDFFMSMHISYPDARDLAEARRLGVDPGGMIMIHGLPNDAEATRTDYLYEDWTDGCIAVSNQAMIDIWLSVPDNTPITIEP